ncbi:hypothetical protein RHGRI_004358 [Rhododendron griersonianum]|uniref:Uncharacterized protein n=1 Tax=Rhododendron griersonianum TaxID=479676 RepID=A0AAV6LB93_9ERIC|nr:hypothetical protein RHGRI_004358 [Rhododendron griersonianum]
MYTPSCSSPLSGTLLPPKIARFGGFCFCISRSSQKPTRSRSRGKVLREMILICQNLLDNLNHPNECFRGVTLRFLCRLKQRNRSYRAFDPRGFVEFRAWAPLCSEECSSSSDINLQASPRGTDTG